MQKRGMFRFILPYLIILGVIVVLFLFVGNGSTYDLKSLEAQRYNELVKTQLVEVYDKDQKGYVVDINKTEDTSDDTYYSIQFKKVQVEEGSTVTGFAGTFELTKVAAPEVVVEDNNFYVSGLAKKDKATYSFNFIVSNNDPLLEDTYFATQALSEIGVIYTTSDATSSSLGLTIILNLLPIVIIVVVGIFLFRSINKQAGGGGAGGAFDFGKSTAKEKKDVHVKFSDVAGCEEEKQEMQELVEYLKNPKKFIEMGARIPKGFLLTGNPGTGKTLLAKAVAGEAGVPFYFISGSDFVEMFVGVGASRVRDMFKKAKEHAPSMIFIDEIDAVGRQRGTGLGGGHDEREQTLNQLLVELDGFGENSGVIVIAATNRPDVLDPALLRPGRFDRQIMVGLPDKNGREAILKVHARNKKVAKEVDFGNIASRTPGFSGAQLENVLNEAAILAVRLNKKEITMSDIDEAIDRVIGGPAKKNKLISIKEKNLIAYHESGHAILGLKLPSAQVVQKVTIIPRGQAGGYVLMTPEHDRFLETKGELLDEITGLLGGRVCEEIFFDDITTGAHNDIQKATHIARVMVTELGMSNLGPIQYERNSGSVFLGRDYTNSHRAFSQEVGIEIDREVRRIIEECYEKARQIITENRETVQLIAQTLLIHETLTNEQIVHLVEKGYLPGEEPKEEVNETTETVEPVATETPSTEVVTEEVTPTEEEPKE